MDFQGYFQCLDGLDPPLVVGVSGGPDSMCLLHSLVAAGWPVVPVHFDHQIRPASGGEAEQVAEILDGWGLELVIERGNVPGAARDQRLSIEEAARNLRYQCLFRLAEERQAGGVLVGHHADDQVETVLMNLLRGTGLAGLTGMAVSSCPNPWSSTIPLLRPLLPVRREQILAYCDRHQIRHITDPSNRERKYLRNRIRQDLIPILEEYNPGIKDRLLQTAEILRADQEVLQQMEENTWGTLQPGAGPGWIRLQAADLLALPIGMQRRMVKKALDMVLPEGTESGFGHVRRALRYLRDRNPSGSLELVHHHSLYRRGEWIYLAHRDAELPPGYFPQISGDRELRITPPGEWSLPSGWVIKAVKKHRDQLGPELKDSNPYRAVVDRSAVGRELVVSGRREGERMQPLGMESGSVKLSDLMINEKIPVYARERWPVIRSGGKPIWVPGLRLADAVRVSPDTERVYVLSLVGPDSA